MKPQTKGFDINKHKHFQTPLEYIGEIYDNKYHFTMEMVSNLLDFKEQYIQVNFMDSLDTLYIDKSNKINIRGILNDFKTSSYLIPQEYCDAVKDLDSRRDILSKRVLISQKSVLELILNTFKKEVKHPEQGIILVDLDKSASNTTTFSFSFANSANAFPYASLVAIFLLIICLLQSQLKLSHIVPC